MAADSENRVQVVPVTQLPADSWVEGFVLRPNGHVLATRLDKAELYTCDPEDPDAEAKMIYEFPDANGLINICTLEGRHDEYAVISGIVDLKTSQFGSCIIWRVAMPEEEGAAPVISKIGDMPNKGFCIGATPASADILLVADCYEDCIRILDINTGETSVLIADATMTVASPDDYFGINRIRVANGFVWYTNTSAGLLCRVPVEADEEKGLRVTGPVEIITSKILHCDGLVVTDDGKSVFSANYLSGVVWEVDVEDGAKGATTSVKTGLKNPTSIEKIDEAGGKVKLYVTCCGDDQEVAWVNDDVRQENLEVSVTVVEEVVEQI